MPINREIRYSSTGDRNSRVQVFSTNIFSDTRTVQTDFFTFNTPKYLNYGGTNAYYNQDPFSIFTNLVRPPIRFVFSANTESLSGDSYFIHEIYRLDYNTYKLYSDNQITNSIKLESDVDTSNDSELNTIARLNAANNTANALNSNTEIPSLGSGINRNLRTNTSLPSGNNPIIFPERLYGQPLTKNDFGTIQKMLSEPLITFTAATSGITSNVYDLYLDQYIKKLGNYKTELFLDKAQFFINTKIVFNLNLNKTYDSYTPREGVNKDTIAWNNNFTVVADTSSGHTISSGPFNGLSVSGNYFTYFTVPDKPKLEYPIPSGVLTTFTPEFRWSNGESADSFLIQINYNTGDTGFTGTVFTYPVEKSIENTKLSESITHGEDSQFSTSKNVYNFQVPVKSNNSFLYRIGNSKEIIDIFDVRRNVVTFSDYYTATSQSEPIRTYVFVEVDSKYVETVAGFSTPPSLVTESGTDEYILSGTVTGGTITGATMVLTYPNSNYVTTVTDSGGTYAFYGLEPGTYSLQTSYRGFQTDTRSVVITNADQVLNFRLKLLWDNRWDTWASLAQQNYFI